MKITGTAGNDTLTVLTNTDSVQAGVGTDTIVFAGNYADYTFSQADSYVSILTHNTTGQVVSLYQVEQLQFDDTAASLTTTPASGEFQVNTYTTSDQYGSSTAALSDGGFVVTWNSNLQDGDGYGVYAQRYDVNGDVNGAEFQVNTYTTSEQYGSSTAALSDGGFVVTWSSLDQDGDGYGVFAQRYDANGDALGEVTINSTPVVASVIADASTTEDSAYSYDASSSFSDADGDTLSYTAKLSNGNALPSWLSISSTGTLSGTPANADVGALAVIVTAADSGALMASDTFTLTVRNVATVIDADGNLWDSTIAVGDGSFIVAEEAQLYRSYFGAMGRLPDEGGYNWWLGEIQAGRHTLESMAAGFVDSSEFKALSDTDNSGAISNEEFILHMYNGVFGRDPDAEGLAWWVGQLDAGTKTQPDAFISMTQSNEYVELTVETVADMMFLQINRSVAVN